MKVISLSQARRQRAREERGLVHRIGDDGELIIDDVDERGIVVQSWELDNEATKALLVDLAKQLVRHERAAKMPPRKVT